MVNAQQQNTANLLPVDWPAIEPHFVAGIRSLRGIGREYGVSHAAICKHAKEFGWVRSLKPQITARAERLVANATAAAVATAVTVATKPSITERITVESNAQAVAMIELAHRDIAAQSRHIASALLAELRATVDAPEVFARVFDMLEVLGGAPTAAQRKDLNDMAALVSSLPARTKVMRDMTDILAKIISMERQAFGLGVEDMTVGRPMVYIKDFTGRGSLEAPSR